MKRSTNGQCVNQLAPLDDELGADGQSTQQHVAVLEGYLKQFLCQPHSELGRRGAVCPMVPVAIKKDTLYASFYSCNGDVEQIKQIVLAEQARFSQLQPTSGNDLQYKSLMICFTDLDSADGYQVIDQAQQQLQQYFVVDGLMVGEFHNAPPNKGGLWNEDFRPLTCPMPMLVIRHMMNMDILFLKDNKFNFGHYLNRFADAIPERFKPDAIACAKRFGLPLDLREANPVVLDVLDQHQAQYRIHRHLTRRDYQVFAQGLDDNKRATQTLFVKSRDCETYAFVVTCAQKNADLSPVAQQLAVRQLDVIPAIELKQKLNYPKEAMTPIGQRDFPTFIDDDLLEYAALTTGGGVQKVHIELTPKDLQAVCQATAVELNHH